MNRYRKAFAICVVGGPIMVGSMLVAGGILSTSLIFGFGTIVVALVGLHLGLWVKSAT